MPTNCSVCAKPSDLDCLICDKAFCINCFANHIQQCREKAAKKRTYCLVCGDPTTTTCSDCSQPFCPSCLGLHEAVHEQKYCMECGSKILFDSQRICKECNGVLCCLTCEALHGQHHKDQQRSQYQTFHFRFDTHYVNWDEIFRAFGQGNTYQHQQQKAPPPPPAQQITTISEAFALLQLSQRATVQEVTRKFRSMAKQGEYRHPDAGGSTEQFQRLNQAYEIAKRHAQQYEVK